MGESESQSVCVCVDVAVNVSVLLPCLLPSCVCGVRSVVVLHITVRPIDVVAMIVAVIV